MIKKISFRSYVLFSICTFCLALSSIAHGMDNNHHKRKREGEKQSSKYVKTGNLLNDELKTITIKGKKKSAKLIQVLVDNEKNNGQDDFRGCFDPITNCFFSSAFGSKKINIWDLGIQKYVECIDIPSNYMVTKISSCNNRSYFDCYAKPFNTNSYIRRVYTMEFDRKEQSFYLSESFYFWDDSILYSPRNHLTEEDEEEQKIIISETKQKTIIQEIIIGTDDPLTAAVKSHCFNKINGLLAICTSHGKVKIFDWQENEKKYVCLKTFNFDEEEAEDEFYPQAKFSADGRYLIVNIHETGCINIIECENNEFSLIQSINNGGMTDLLDCHPTKNLFAIGLESYNKSTAPVTQVQIWQLPGKPNVYSRKMKVVLNKKIFDDLNFVFDKPWDNL